MVVICDAYNCDMIMITDMNISGYDPSCFLSTFVTKTADAHVTNFTISSIYSYPENF